MEILYVFLTGLSVGSFLNVCIYRIPRGESLVLDPSHCPGCGELIKASDLLPVISYFLLKGRCRDCGRRISFRYPAVELAAGLFGVMLFMKFGTGLEFFKYAMLVSVLIVIGMIDLETGEVYTSTIAAGAAAGAVFAAIAPGTCADSVLGALTGFAVIAAIALTGGMGWGDADICLLCGLFLGVRCTLVMLLVSFIAGGAAGIFLITSSKRRLNDSMPFGPFLAVSAIVSLFFGNSIVSLYFNMTA
ncbi:MAG: prepilin signal peptidase PulO-like peptidase [Firmicutes bacterium]|nr:prepilin signal peptidase PulO-like peptidase [Bacillota bacterium]